MIDEPTTGLPLATTVLPLASVSDADTTCRARPYLLTTDVIVVHGIEKRAGCPVLIRSAARLEHGRLSTMSVAVTVRTWATRVTDSSHTRREVRHGW